MIESLDRAIPGCDSAIIRLVAVVKIEDIAVVSRGSGILTKPQSRAPQWRGPRLEPSPQRGRPSSTCQRVI